MKKGNKWAKIKNLWNKVIDLNDKERNQLLSELRESDPDLVEEVEKLLANDETGDLFMEEKDSDGDLKETISLNGFHEELEDFEILTEIGKGGHGIIFKARQISLNRVVAIKILMPHIIVSNDAINRFQREAQAAAKLHHKHIVSVYSVHSSPTLNCYVMRWIDGPDLSKEIDTLNPRILPKRSSKEYLTHSVRVVYQIAKALEYAHENGIVHRDVKPHNILIDQSGDALLTDFGIARDNSLGTITKPGNLAGTVAYMSPEQARAIESEKIDHRTDIYSLGVVLYQLLTNKLPFDGKNAEVVLQRLKSEEPIRVRKITQSIPRDLEDICHQAIAKSADERYESASLFAQDLENFLNHKSPINITKPTIWSTSRKYFNKYKRQLSFLSITVVCLFIGYLFSDYYYASLNNSTISVSAVDSSLNKLENIKGFVQLIEINKITGLPIDEVNNDFLLGNLPLNGAQVKSGFYRIVVKYENDTFIELTRLLEKGKQYNFSAVYSDRLKVNAQNMVLIQGDKINHPVPEIGTVCPLAGRTLYVDSFWIDKYEVTNAEYKKYLKSISQLESDLRPTYWPSENSWDETWDNLPVVGVSWEEARDFAEWSGKRLVSHPEWERAARGSGSGTLFPWGNERKIQGVCSLNPILNSEELNAINESVDPNFKKSTLYKNRVQNVNSHSESAKIIGDHSIHHLYGNVAEWCESLLVVNARSDNPIADPMHRYAMGGYWAINPMKSDLADSHERRGIGIENRSHRIGFRCAKSFKIKGVQK